MGITWVRNGVVTDRPAEENDAGPAGDGRTYLPYASRTYHVDGTADVVTGRAFNSAIQLPPSANISKVLGSTVKSETSEHPEIIYSMDSAPKTYPGSIYSFPLSKNTIDSVAQAKADVDASVRTLQATRDAETQAVISNAMADAANFQSATNLTRVSGVPGTNVATFVVKPTSKT